MKPEELIQLKKDHDLLGVYFKTDECRVCSALLPRLKETFTNHKIHLEVVNLKESPELVGTEMVMNVPVLKVFENQREVFKEGAYMNIKKVGDLLFQYNKMGDSSRNTSYF